MRDDVLTPTIEDGAVRRLAAWSCTTAKRTRWAARTAWITWSFGVLLTICWRPSRTLAEATWTAGAARRRRASLRGKDLTSRAAEPDLTLQRSHRPEATGSVRNPRLNNISRPPGCYPSRQQSRHHRHHLRAPHHPKDLLDRRTSSSRRLAGGTLWLVMLVLFGPVSACGSEYACVETGGTCQDYIYDPDICIQVPGGRADEGC